MRWRLRFEEFTACLQFVSFSRFENTTVKLALLLSKMQIFNMHIEN